MARDDAWERFADLTTPEIEGIVRAIQARRSAPPSHRITDEEINALDQLLKLVEQELERRRLEPVLRKFL